MTVPIVPVYTGDIPLRDGSQTNEEFSVNVGDILSYIPPMVTDLNASLVWANATNLEVDANRILTQTAASTATNAASTATTQAGIAVAAASSATLAPGTSATSTSTITPGYGSKSFTLAETGKTFVVGQFVTVSDSVDPANKFFNGPITSFDSGSGAITVDSRAFFGMTSGSSWVVTGSAPAFGQRFTNPTQSWVNLGNVSGAVNLDLRVATSFDCVLTGNTTFTFTMPDGYSATDSISWALRLKQGASVYTIGYPAGTKFHQGSQAITGASATDEFVFKKLGTGDAFYRRAGNGFA